MRTGHGALGFAQLLQQPIHLASVERHVHLDGRMAGYRGRDPVSQNLEGKRLPFLAYRVQNFNHQLFHILSETLCRSRLDGHRALPERLDLKAVRC